jgi:hypothetical protein
MPACAGFQQSEGEDSAAFSMHDEALPVSTKA